MLRISKIADTPSSVTLKVEGRIVEEWGPFLVAKILKHSCERQKVLLDLSGVTFIDEPAATDLTALSGDNVEIINCSAFVGALLFKGGSNDSGNESN